MPVDGTAARITVERTSPSDLGFREIFVSIDGEDVAVLRNGESVTRDVPAGPHRLRAHNTLIRKKADLDLRPGEHARFLAVMKPGWGTYSVLAIIGAGPIYMDLTRLPDEGR
jgi:hypothetical protein